jgi:hypothetical protein
LIEYGKTAKAPALDDLGFRIRDEGFRMKDAGFVLFSMGFFNPES